jgi:hypothetical protein
MHSRHEPQSSSSGAVASTAMSVTKVPKTTQDPKRRVIISVFLP